MQAPGRIESRDQGFPASVLAPLDFMPEIWPMSTLHFRKPARILHGTATLGFAFLLQIARPLAAQMGTTGADTGSNVKETLNVSGQSEALAPLRDMAHDPLWDLSPNAACEAMHSYSEKGVLEAVIAPGDRKLLASQGTFNVILDHRSLAEMDAYLGEMEQAIE